MKIEIGEKAADLTFQDTFSKKTKCVHCSEDAEIIYGSKEDGELKHICMLHENDPKGKGLWPHDNCAFVSYFCRKCGGVTTLWNQA